MILLLLGGVGALAVIIYWSLKRGKGSSRYGGISIDGLSDKCLGSD